MDFTKLTLGKLLTHKDHTIYRNSMSILKRLQKLNPQDEEMECQACGEMIPITRDIKGNIVPEDCLYCK